MPSFEVTPIGAVRNNRTDVQHTDNGGAVRSTITVDERFGEACLQGLEGFSHVEVLFIVDQFPERDDYREPAPTAAAPTSHPSASSPVAAPADRTASASRPAPSSPFRAAN